MESDQLSESTEPDFNTKESVDEENGGFCMKRAKSFADTIDIASPNTERMLEENLQSNLPKMNIPAGFSQISPTNYEEEGMKEVGVTPESNMTNEQSVDASEVETLERIQHGIQQESSRNNDSEAVIREQVAELGRNQAARMVDLQMLPAPPALSNPMIWPQQVIGNQLPWLHQFPQVPHWQQYSQWQNYPNFQGGVHAPPEDGDLLCEPLFQDESLPEMSPEQRSGMLKEFWQVHKPCPVRKLTKNSDGKYKESQNKRQKCANAPNCFREGRGDKWCDKCNVCLHWDCYVCYHMEVQSKSAMPAPLPYKMCS